jgi:hypothetical protein
MNKLFFLATAMLSCGIATADVKSETTCYSRAPPGQSSKSIHLTLRTYVDQDLQREIGAFVQYNGSKEVIPLVFTKHVRTDIDSPDLGNYEISRIEISDKKVAGEYVFAQTGAGIAQGKYVTYKNSKTGKVVTFQHTGDDDPACKIRY